MTFKEHLANYDWEDGYTDEDSIAVNEIYSLSPLPDDRFERAFNDLSDDQFSILMTVYNEYKIACRIK